MKSMLTYQSSGAVQQPSCQICPYSGQSTVRSQKATLYPTDTIHPFVFTSTNQTTSKSLETTFSKII